MQAYEAKPAAQIYLFFKQVRSKKERFCAAGI
jgi:hypothetical protein